MNRKISVVEPAERNIYDIFFVVCLLLFVVCTIFTGFSPLELLMQSGQMWSFLADDFFPPAIPSQAKLEIIISSIITTIAMALGATTIAAILAFFVSLMASEMVSPVPKAAKFIRGFVTFLRNIPALVWAFILFSSLGIGTGVGFIALCITSFSFLVRAFVETMEDISVDCLESLQALGASFWQRVVQGIIPSCMSGFIAWFLYCIEVNVRASTIVGMVGGGGIGMVLFSYIKSFNYNMASTIIIMIAIIVIAVDRITGFLRRELAK